MCVMKSQPHDSHEPFTQCFVTSLQPPALTQLDGIIWISNAQAVLASGNSVGSLCVKFSWQAVCNQFKLYIYGNVHIC